MPTRRFAVSSHDIDDAMPPVFLPADGRRVYFRD